MAGPVAGMDLYAELLRVVEALDRAGVGYALVGGLAVSIYAAPRATEDIDLMLTAEDLDRATRALEPLGFRRAGSPMRVAAGRLQIQRLIKIEGRDLLPLDLLVATDEALAASVGGRQQLAVEGRPVWIIGVEGLRRLKRLRGSAQDRADLEALGPDGS